jgi:cytochrome P450
MTEAALRDHMVTFVLAGHETTATALAWAYYELSRHPHIQRLAQVAADHGGDEYLLAVIKEAMRRRPVSQNSQRTLSEDTTVAGYHLPAGTVVAPNIYLVQRDPEVWDEPAEFRPERFLGRAPQAGTWVPFGGGVRRCIGAAFAEQEAVASLRAVLQRYDLWPAGGRPEKAKARNVTLVPSRGARIIATHRER